MTICHSKKTKAFAACCVVFLVALGAQAPAFAMPRVPTQDSEVLERLPMRPADSTARTLAALRESVRQSAATDPRNPQAAVALAEQYFQLALSRGDPRYVGYADATIKPFAAQATADLWSMRGQLLQYRHGFEGALTSFDAALKLDPDFAAAHAWRGAIYLVQANYGAAQGECAALLKLQRPVLHGGCSGLVHAYSGRLDEGLRSLQDALRGTQDPGNRLWLLTRVGEVQAWRGQPALAEKAYREALDLGLDDGYLLAAWSDFLLDQNRPSEVVRWLANWEASDGLLLRLALAETQLKSPKAGVHVQALADRFAAAKARADTTHRAEEARFLLHLRGDPAMAVQTASANYQVQREPRDARILLEAAISAKDPAAAKPVIDWLRSSGFEDPHLRKMAQSFTAPPFAKAATSGVAR